MASSPPFNQNVRQMPSNTVALCKKRPSLAASPPPNVKRRKPSTGPSSLRQTSFPAGNSTAVDIAAPCAYSRSPSVDSLIAPSLVSAGGKAPISMKSRRLKTREYGRTTDNARSAVGTNFRDVRAGAMTGIASLVAEQGGVEGDDADDDDDVGGLEAVVEGGEKMDEAARKQEQENLSVLMGKMNRDQTERYDTWRRVKLKKETVRKITNQTLSQSVPASVVISINGYTKVFIGDLIDRARSVQYEWLAASPTLPTGEPNPAWQALHHSSTDETPQDLNNEKNKGNRTCTSVNAIYQSTPISRLIQKHDIGPLMPDHLREALRRMKNTRQGDGVGFLGLSLEGRERTAARGAGRMVFR